MNDVKAKTGALLKETAVLTGAVAIIAASVYFFLVPTPRRLSLFTMCPVCSISPRPEHRM